MPDGLGSPGILSSQLSRGRLARFLVSRHFHRLLRRRLLGSRLFSSCFLSRHLSRRRRLLRSRLLRPRRLGWRLLRRIREGGCKECGVLGLVDRGLVLTPPHGSRVLSPLACSHVYPGLWRRRRSFEEALGPQRVLELVVGRAGRHLHLLAYGVQQRHRQKIARGQHHTKLLTHVGSAIDGEHVTALLGPLRPLELPEQLAAAAGGGGRDGLVQFLLFRVQLIVLRLANIVILAAQVVANALDWAHARAVAIVARVEALVDGIGRRGGSSGRWLELHDLFLDLGGSGLGFGIHLGPELEELLEPERLLKLAHLLGSKLYLDPAQLCLGGGLLHSRRRRACEALLRLHDQADASMAGLRRLLRCRGLLGLLCRCLLRSRLLYNRLLRRGFLARPLGGRNGG